MEFLPGISSSAIDEKLIKDATKFKYSSSLGKIGTQKAKKMGLCRWKGGYVKNVLVKSNFRQGILKHLVKSRVHVSMKNLCYYVYVDIEQQIWEMLFLKCDCKAGQCGGSKHFAVLPFTLLDYFVV